MNQITKPKSLYCDNNITKPRSSLFISKQILQSYGCKNCIWKSYGQCPKGFTEPEEICGEFPNAHPVGSDLPIGYCVEMSDFLFGLAEGSDSISAVKEKFMLYTQEMQAMADHTEYQQLFKKYKQGKSEGKSDKDLYELLSGINMYRLWWQNLTASIVKGLSRIADRERRSEDVDKSSGKITIQQLNVLLKDSDKYFETKQPIKDTLNITEIKNNAEHYGHGSTDDGAGDVPLTK